MDSNVPQGNFDPSQSNQSWIAENVDESANPQLTAEMPHPAWQDFITWDTNQSSSGAPPNMESQSFRLHNPANSMPFSVPTPAFEDVHMEFSPVHDTASQNPFRFPNNVADQTSPFSPHSQTSGRNQSNWIVNSPTEMEESSHASVRKQSAQTDSTNADSPESPADNSVSSATLKKKGSSRKRKSTILDESPEASDSKEHPRKSSHNMIEKRYRTNINDKIAALRDTVPSLRVITRNGGEGDEDLEGLAPAHKLNKANILAKATEYIRHLQKQKSRMEQDIKDLQARVDAYEKMIRVGTLAVPTPLPTPEGVRFQDGIYPIATSSAIQHSSSISTQGMIPVPESIAMLRRTQMSQPPYNPIFAAYAQPPPQQQQQSQTQQPAPENSSTQRRGSSSGRGGKMGRVMLGGLTTLMVAEQWFQRNEKKDSVQAKGLMSAPFSINDILQSSSTDDSYVSFLSFARTILIFCSILYLVSPIFTKKQESKKPLKADLNSHYSLASPVELRQSAWLTSVQTVWVPRHNFILEVAALFLKMLKLSTRTLIGWKGYSMITGSTKEQEIARVKAWRIALDAQLTGGDSEISTSRLVLTLLASGTLPSTPIQLMLKALHIHILFREVAQLPYSKWLMLSAISNKLARRYWNAARIEHRVRCHCKDKKDDDYDLPDHLAALLELDADDIFLEPIVQRAYNLAWNRPIFENANCDPIMDSVVADVHITSPLEALAAWWSTNLLNRLLDHTLYNHTKETREVILSDLELVLEIAPPPSTARVRALAAQAVLVDSNRAQNIQLAMDALPRDLSVSTTSESPTSSSHRSSSPIPIGGLNMFDEAPIDPELPIALTLAKCLDWASATNSDPEHQAHLMLAVSCVNNNLPIHQYASVGGFGEGSSKPFTLLSFVAHLAVLEKYVDVDTLRGDSREGLERVAAGLRIWVGSKEAAGLLEERARAEAVSRCLSVRKTLMGMGNPLEEDGDGGYFSMEDSEEDIRESGLKETRSAVVLQA